MICEWSRRMRSDSFHNIRSVLVALEGKVSRSRLGLHKLFTDASQIVPYGDKRARAVKLRRVHCLRIGRMNGLRILQSSISLRGWCTRCLPKPLAFQLSDGKCFQAVDSEWIVYAVGRRESNVLAVRAHGEHIETSRFGRRKACGTRRCGS